jgi:WS/DGAT/MGAT family acyltransferase
MIVSMRGLRAPRTRRLSPLDASFLYLEKPTELLHVGSVALLDGAVDFDALLSTLAGRLGALPRYHQRPVRSPFDLAPPAWEDDPDYDPRRHIRRVRAPAPGGDAELHALVDTLFAAPMDRHHPLWDAYLIEGLAGGRTAILAKVHHCMIDGVSGAQVLELMTEGATQPAPPAPRAEPGPLAAVLGRGREAVAQARALARALASPRTTLAQALRALEAAGTLGALASPASPQPFNGGLSGHRRIAWARFALDDFLAMRGVAGCKVNDVVLTVIAGALRRYLPERNGGVAPRPIRTLVPVSIRTGGEQLALGNRVSAMIATLPVDVADPLERLRRVATELRALKEHGQPQAMSFILTAAGGLPPPLAPLVTTLGMRLPVVHTVCTNVPGPREPRRLLGRRVLEIHGIVPIAAGIGLGFAILSYAGQLSICATADAALVPDVERIPEALYAAEAELRECLGVAPAASVPAAAPTGPAVADLMTRDVAVLAPLDSLARAWEIMRVGRLRHLPVVDDRGHLLGLLSHRDLLAASQSSLSFQREEERVRLLAWARAADVMETHVSTAAPTEPAAAAGRRMARHKIGCLPVVEGGRLTGIVTESDFLRWATDHMAASTPAA